MVNDREWVGEFIGVKEDRIPISFNPSTNLEIFNECKSHMNITLESGVEIYPSNNPPSKVSASYQLVFTIKESNLAVSEGVDLIGLRQQTQNDERDNDYDIFLYFRGIPARLTLNKLWPESEAALYLISKSVIPSFEGSPSGVDLLLEDWKDILPPK